MVMTSSATLVTRTGCSDVPQGNEHIHALVLQVVDRPGSVDRVVGVLRRRRARLQSFNLSQSSMSDMMHITVLVKDTEVGIEHLFEQLRKIVDVKHIESVLTRGTDVRELVLMRVSTGAEAAEEIKRVAQQFGARIVEAGADAVVLEMSGSEAEVAAFLAAMSSYKIQEVVRSGSVTPAN
jgi:acetolactate synthase I/III small subunit